MEELLAGGALLRRALPAQSESIVKRLRLILGDQLQHDHSWFETVDDDTTYLIMEMNQELTYVAHHVQKVVAFFLAMRAFAAFLESEGHRVLYLRLDDPRNRQNLEGNLKWALEHTGAEHFAYQLPDEWRLDRQLESVADGLGVDWQATDTEHFLTSRDDLGDFFGDKQLLMETFYRHMRRTHDVLMNGDEPVGGKWNFDHDNRKKLPKSVHVPLPKVYPQDVTDVLRMLEEHGAETLGELDPEAFIWPVTREDTLDLLEFFIEHCLEDFGAYQDAMTLDHWSIFHSRLSLGLNLKLIHPMEVIRRVEACLENDPDRYPQSSVEGYIRQILGWREFMRGVYWRHMPDYAEMNFFGHDRPLPGWFWTGETDMKCLSHAVGQSLAYAYAHHIQRLMITGNFALLAGIDPDAVDRWYLGIYIDAVEWVEITNTRGMSQFADGGIVATKPYVSSANYIHKMGRYCGSCAYSHSKKTGEGACPFNSLYWHFIETRRPQLETNHRMSMMYRLWDKRDADDRRALLDQAESYLSRLDEL